MMQGAGTHFQWRSASQTHVGTARKVNEDACLERPEIGLWAVADGMGGHAAGDVASTMVVDSLRDLSLSEDQNSLINDIEGRLQGVNSQLRRYARSQGPGTIVGSTVAAFAGFGTKAICLWAGDSRIYRLRDSGLQQLTRDHSQVEELVALGMLNRDEAATHRERNVITRAVGAGPELEIELRIDELQAGDYYVLCSDGLNKAVSDEEIATIMLNSNVEETVRALLRLSLIRGARDNVTLVVIEISARPPTGAG